jgi:hypothetical protein
VWRADNTPTYGDAIVFGPRQGRHPDSGRSRVLAADALSSGKVPSPFNLFLALELYLLIK